MKAKSSIIFAFAGVICTGCTSPPTEIDGVPASKVIDMLKSELRAAKPSSTTIEAHGAACSNANGVTVSYVPTSATVALKTVATNATSGSLGLTVPISTVTLGPSFTFTQTRVDTETVTYDLAIPGHSEAQLLADAKATKAEIDTYNAELADAAAGILVLSQDQKNFLKSQITADNSKLGDTEKQLVAAQQQRVNSGAGSSLLDAHFSIATPVTSHTEKLKQDVSIAEAISAASKELLDVDHNALPCLKPQDVKVEIDFDVQKKSDGSISLSVVFLKFGAENVYTNENFHSMLVTFDLTQSSLAVQ